MEIILKNLQLFQQYLADLRGKEKNWEHWIEIAQWHPDVVSSQVASLHAKISHLSKVLKRSLFK